ncbi:MAG TPA: UDP-2,3-diacylglucosamine diphosphatase [Steroidobacteraceae bacterium]|jgi:UDP-2,3-diacylglucosamine hydrolase|nr:UDP-2,3-diacylglucosamine diphosphatase [Steroidobacteraceae bacterium]
MSTLFVSDLHLDAQHPEITSQFLEFLSGEARQAQALYILGDLFEVWIGDDDPEPEKRRVIAALRALTASGVPCYVMHGNRDFLLGERFCADSGCQLLEDPTIIHLHGQRVLTMHGDALCTDDHAYQKLRAMVRDPGWQRMFLALSHEQRRMLAEQARAGSKAHIAQAMSTIMDVNQQAVATAMRATGVQLLLHGHTHRPNVHRFDLDGTPAARIVLGDWYDQGSVLRWDEGGFDLQSLGRH